MEYNEEERELYDKNNGVFHLNIALYILKGCTELTSYWTIRM